MLTLGGSRPHSGNDVEVLRLGIEYPTSFVDTFRIRHLEYIRQPPVANAVDEFLEVEV
jgi:hypothetical protein